MGNETDELALGLAKQPVAVLDPAQVRGLDRQSKAGISSESTADVGRTIVGGIVRHEHGQVSCTLLLDRGQRSGDELSPVVHRHTDVT